MSIIIILFILLILFAAVIYLIYRIAFYSPDKVQNDFYNFAVGEQYDPYADKMKALVDDLLSRPFEEVSITSYDGLKLCARYYHFHDGAPLDIAFHGYRGTGVRDMCGGVVISYTCGHNVLLIDERSHGKSGGHTITFGIKERYDVCSWVEYARKRFGENCKILLYGISMGAATVLMASEFDFGGSVRGIIADCPYSSPVDIIKKVSRDMKLPSDIVFPFVLLAAKLFGGFNLRDATAKDAVAKSKLPVLILHGDDDRFVPDAMSLEIADARPNIERHTFHGVGHGMSCIVYPREYSKYVTEFMMKVTK